MKTLSKALLVANAGSSSLKLDVYDSAQNKTLHINCDYDDPQNCRVLITDVVGDKTEEVTIVLGQVMNVVKDLLLKYVSDVAVVGHRFVHGGGKFTDTVMIDDTVLEQLEQLSVVDAEHTPVAVRIVKYFSQVYPTAMQVACFDTTFFKDLPEIVTKLPIPKKFYEKGIRKYGFHGLSYSYVLDEFTRVCGERAARGRVIVAHLGSGSSLAAIVNGKPVDTTMSYTPCSGIVMSSRSGDIDPGVYWHMIANENMSNDETFAMFNNQSGLMGVSGTTGDMELLLVEENNNEDAKAAVELFCYRIKQTIGSYAAVMGGVDSIIFCGGIGERSSVIRQRILEGLECLGVIIDKDRNSKHLERISDNTSRVGVHVIHTDESRSILREMVKKMNNSEGGVI